MSIRPTTLILATLLAVATSSRATTPSQQCAASKIKAAGKKAACLLYLDAKVAGGATADPIKLQQCADRLSDPEKGAFARAEARGGCAVGGDAVAVEGTVDAFVADVYGALNIGTPNACQAAKIRAAGKKASCLLVLQAKNAAGHGLDMGKVQVCEDQLSGPDGTFAREDAQGGCATTNDAATIEMKVDAFVDAIVAAEPTAATCAIAECPAPLACDTMAGACWQPPLQTRPQYQLQAAHTPSGDCNFAASGGIDTSISAVPFIGGAPVSPEVYDIDFLTDPVCAAGGSNDVDNTAGVNAIHTAGAKAICYVDAGTDEPFRPDHQDYVDFDTACGGCLFGKPVAGFREERWLNINDDQGQRGFILGKVDARVDRCKADGFDAVEFDNVEAYPNPTGLPISEATQLVFNTALANLAHAKGLTVGLKNDVAQVAELLPYFDFAINEQCQEFDECSTLDPFLAAGKPVFQVEYQVGAGTVCPAANGANRNAILKSVDLFDTPWTPCR